MNDKIFDRIIRERLSGVGSGHQPSGWAYLQRRLDAADAAGPETDSLSESFDEAIREKLVPATQVPLVPHWDALEERLDQVEGGVPEPDDTAIDVAVFQKLRNFRVPFRRDHWFRMAEKLDGEFVNPALVWRSKLVELGLMALLLFTLWQNFPENSSAVSSFFDSASTPKDILNETAPGPSLARQSGPEGFESEVSSAGGPPALAERNPASSTIGPSNPGSSGSVLSSGLANQMVQQREVVPSFSPLPILRNNRALRRTPENHLNLLKLQKEGQWLPQMVQAPGLASLYPATVASQGHFEQDLYGAVKPVQQRRPFIHFGMFGSLDYNRIISPSKYLLDTRLQEFDRYELGYSGGITLGFDFGPWELQSGAIYSSKQYRPLLAELWEGEFDEGYNKTFLKDIQLNVVQIPIMLRYNLIHYDAWRFYMTAGASVHVAVTANYFYDNIGNGDIAEPNSGWLDGGSFRENSFLTGNVGFGLERFVSPSWSLFAQPTYQHALNMFHHGMGPTQDRISTMSLYTGIRVRLER